MALECWESYVACRHSFRRVLICSQNFRSTLMTKAIPSNPPRPPLTANLGCFCAVHAELTNVFCFEDSNGFEVDSIDYH